MEKTKKPTERLLTLAVASRETKGGTLYPVHDGLLGTRKDMPPSADQ
jgi:hypothetical protein